MKILVVCQYYYPEPFRITDICESLAQRGHQVTVLTGLPNYPEGKVLADYRHGKKKREQLNNVEVIRSFEIGRGCGKVNLFLNYLSFACSSCLKVLFLRKDYDVIFVNQLSPVTMAWAGLRYKKKRNTPLLLYCLDLWPESLTAGGINKDSFLYRVILRISQKIYKQADKIAVTSNSFKSYFDKVIGINPECIVYLPQYTEELFTNVDAKLENSESFHFVFAGNIGSAQSVDTIVRAAAELQDKAEIHFDIVGDGSSLSACKELAQGLKNITFHGRKPLEAMPSFYTFADAMLVTLKDNPFTASTLPGKIQSYMAAGKPILGAINGETRFVISEANCGLCCEAEDYKGLADLCIQFVKTNAKEEMSENARKYYNRNYSKQAFIETLEKELFELRR